MLVVRQRAAAALLLCYSLASRTIGVNRPYVAGAWCIDQKAWATHAKVGTIHRIPGKGIEQKVIS